MAFNFKLYHKSRGAEKPKKRPIHVKENVFTPCREYFVSQA